MSDNINLFNESVGYEVYLIINSLKYLERNCGISKSSGIKFMSHEYKTHTMNLYDSFAGNAVPEFIKKNMIPLVFTSSFKIMDMFIEYLIKYNKFDCPWQFKEKIKLLDREIRTVSFPKVFDKMEIKDIYYLYKNLVKYRNLLIHGAWGKIDNEKMIFQDKNKIFEISIEQVLALANITQLIIRIMNSEIDSMFFNSYKITMQRELNHFALIIGSEFVKYPDAFVLYHAIQYDLAEEDEEKVNIATIKKFINSSIEANKLHYPTQNFSAVYEIFVEKNSKRWRIPSNQIKEDCEEILLKDYCNHLESNE